MACFICLHCNSVVLLVSRIWSSLLVGTMALLVGSLPIMLLGGVAVSNFATASATSLSETESLASLESQEKNVSFDERSARFLNHLWHDYAGTLLAEEGRRKHYRKVFPILVTGFMILMSLMVPLGFQFMAMIGGKALLMSKMALVLASLQNFKRANLAPPVYPPSHSVSVPHLLDHHGFHERYSPRVGVGVVDNRVH